jgi:hypothetical protein
MASSARPSTTCDVYATRAALVIPRWRVKGHHIGYMNYIWIVLYSLWWASEFMLNWTEIQFLLLLLRKIWKVDVICCRQRHRSRTWGWCNLAIPNKTEKLIVCYSWKSGSRMWGSHHPSWRSCAFRTRTREDAGCWTFSVEAGVHRCYNMLMLWLWSIYCKM